MATQAYLLCYNMAQVGVPSCNLLRTRTVHASPDARTVSRPRFVCSRDGAGDGVVGCVGARGSLRGRGLHSFTSQLNLSAFCGIEGTLRGFLGGVWGVSGGIKGCLGCILFQKWLRLS
jgi:hypothetical protein